MGIKRNHIIIFIIVAACSYFIFELFLENNEKKYADEILKMRAEKDIYFQSSEESPVKNIKDFTGLSYFLVNPSFRFQGTYQKDSSTDKEITVRMSDGVNEKFVHSGNILFEKDKIRYKLISFKNPDDPVTNRLFVPFLDNTSGESTYGGGRYLDLNLNGEKVIIDFNLAYHPYCLYSPNYICPIPPSENQLPFAVTAGEKLP